jgi:hypothetical protein
MIKKLLFLFLIFSGITFYHANNKTEKKNGFFCDTLAPTNVQMGNITLTSGTVSWTADPNTPNNMVRIRPVGSSSWLVITVIPAGQTFYNFAGLMSCTAYEVQVVKICNSVTGTWSNPVIFSTYLDYCTSASTNSNVAYISNVTVTPIGFSPMVSNSGTSNYTDYRPDPNRKVQLLVGSVNNQISVSKSWFATPSAVSVRAWIDFNADGIFQAGEMMLSSNSTTSQTAVSSFTVPTSAFQTGSSCVVAMRVIISETYTSSVCGTFTYGEVEDYGVYILSTANLSTNETEKTKELSIYPNPVSEILNISGISSETDFEIYNATGQKVSLGKTKDYQVDVHQLLKGVYFIQINDKGKTSRLKFIKK